MVRLSANGNAYALCIHVKQVCTLYIRGTLTPVKNYVDMNYAQSYIDMEWHKARVNIARIFGAKSRKEIWSAS